jgi:hypothetical protein
MKTRYTYRTPAGLFSIVLQSIDGNWHAMFEDEDLGPYSTAQQAAEAIAGGETYWPSCGDPSRLSLPDEIADWS